MAAIQRILLPVVIAVFLFGCGGSPSPDTVLFSRANEALDRGDFDVALIDLATLVNTYPKSEYAKQAESMLQNDPRLDCNKPTDRYFFMGKILPCTVGSA